MAGVSGLIFLAFPLHPAGRPGTERAAHLEEVGIPMLFIQGTRDELASLELLRPVIARLGGRATLHLIQDADHSFHVPARRRAQADVLAGALDELSAWVARLADSIPR
jgi:predicted alpha/beta-hydrolase family hydrolase